MGPGKDNTPNKTPLSLTALVEIYKVERHKKNLIHLSLEHLH